MSERFHRESPPYLFSTELPFQGLKGLAAPGASCLAVAGSGDVPLWLLSLGASLVVGVDVSLNSLALAEIKAAAAEALSFEEFVYFFLSGSGRAASLLPPEARPGPYAEKRWRVLASRVRESLSRRARRMLDGLDPEGRNPFVAMLRPTDLAVLGGIPFLVEKEVYREVSRAAAPYPLVASRVEDYLSSTTEGFHLIYLSNLVEYAVLGALAEEGSRRARDEIFNLCALAARRLLPGGAVVSYHFHSEERCEPCCEAAGEALARAGCQVEKVPVRHARSSPLAARFHHHLSVARAPRPPGEG